MTPIAVASDGLLGKSSLSFATLGFLGTGNIGGMLFPVFIDEYQQKSEEEIILSVMMAVIQIGILE